LNEIISLGRVAPDSGMTNNHPNLYAVIVDFNEKIFPEILKGKNIIVAAHGNSLRSIVMHLDNLTKEQVLELNIPTGAPLLYVFDKSGKILEHRYL